MKRTKKENRLKKNFDAVEKQDFLSDRQKRQERKLWKKKMSKLSRQKDKKALDRGSED